MLFLCMIFHIEKAQSNSRQAPGNWPAIKIFCHRPLNFSLHSSLIQFVMQRNNFFQVHYNLQILFAICIIKMRSVLREKIADFHEQLAENEAIFSELSSLLTTDLLAAPLAGKMGWSHFNSSSRCSLSLLFDQLQRKATDKVLDFKGLGSGMPGTPLDEILTHYCKHAGRKYANTHLQGVQANFFQCFCVQLGGSGHFFLIGFQLLYFHGDWRNWGTCIATLLQ